MFQNSQKFLIVEQSNLISNGDPAIVQVISSTEDFQIVPIGYQCFCNLIDFFWFLRLPSSLAENDIAFNIVFHSSFHVSLESYQASLFCMLQIITMTLSNFSGICLFAPSQFIDEPVVELLHHFQSKSVLGINDPNHNKTI